MSVRYGPLARSTFRTAERPGAGRVLLGFRAPPLTLPIPLTAPVKLGGKKRGPYRE